MKKVNTYIPGRGNLTTRWKIQTSPASQICKTFKIYEDQWREGEKPRKRKRIDFSRNRDNSVNRG